MSTITIELCAEDRARLDNILAALIATRPNCERCAGTVAEMFAEAAEPQPMEFEEPPAEQPAAEQKTVPAAAPQVKREDVQTRVVKLSAVSAERKAAVRSIVMEYADRVSGIPEDKLSEVMERLNELEGAA